MTKWSLDEDWTKHHFENHFNKQNVPWKDIFDKLQNAAPRKILKIKKKINTIRKLIKFCILQSGLSLIGLLLKYFNICSNIECPLEGQLSLGS